MKSEKRGVFSAAGGRRPIILCAVTLLIAAAILFGALSPALVSGAAKTQADIDRLNSQLSQTKSKKTELKDQINSLSKDKKKIENEIALLDEQIDIAQEEIDLQEELIENLNVMIVMKTAELEQSILEEQEQYQKSKIRIRNMAEQGSTSYLSILLSAEDFADFLTKYEATSQIADHDANVLDALHAISEDVKVQKQELEDTIAMEQSVKEEMEANITALENDRASKSQYMEELQSQESAAQKEYAEAIEREEQLIEDIRKATAELAAQTSYIGGDFMWPLPASNKTITCVYGPRIHPITKKNSIHTGVDIAASTGVKIYAANGGTVTTAGYSTAYGNYVIINHGGGYSTLYAHMSKKAVSKGDTVSRGDVIGYVGSTGYSTGPHLHFEIIKNGSTIDPLKHESFKDMKVNYS